MKPILRATAILSGSSLITILVGLLSAKAWALLLGPGGLGFMGLLQSLAGLAGLIAAMGVGSGLVRFGASAIDRGDTGYLAALYRAAWLLCAGLGLIAVAAMAVFSYPIAALMLGDSSHWPYVILMSLTVLLTMVAGLQGSYINAHHRVGILARIAVLNTVAGAVTGLLIVWRGGAAAVPLAVVATSAVGCVITTLSLRRSGLVHPARPEWPAVRAAAVDLLRFGGPYTASLLVGQGVQMIMPALALHQLGAEGVGYYRAALVISVTYLGFLLSAMGQDYYPRISAATVRPDELVTLINQQHRLVMLLAAPIILGLLVLSPVLVPLVYTPAFAPATAVLEWQLAGDLLKFSSWTMAFVVLARSGSAVFFGTELVAGLTSLVTSWVGMRLFGIAGLGIGFVATYLVYYVIVWAIVRRAIGFRWSRENVLLLSGALVAVIVVRVLPLLTGELVGTLVALLVVCVVGIGSVAVIWQELQGVSQIHA